MTLAKIKTALRAGKYAWPGGYPLYFVTSDGCVLSFEAVYENWCGVVDAHLCDLKSCGWHIAGIGINWEDEALYCGHSGEQIECAYPSD